MPIVNRIADFHAEMTEWRQALHAHPETAFEEVWTSDFVANKLSRIRVYGKSRAGRHRRGRDDQG